LENPPRFAVEYHPSYFLGLVTRQTMPQHLIAYARAQFGRASVRRYLAHLPTAP